MPKVTYHEYNQATGRHTPRQAEICGPVAVDADGDKVIVAGQMDVIRSNGNDHKKFQRAYQNLRVNFAKPGRVPQWKSIDGVSQSRDYFNNAAKSYFTIEDGEWPAYEPDAPEERKPKSKKAKPAAEAPAPVPDTNTGTPDDGNGPPPPPTK